MTGIMFLARPIGWGFKVRLSLPSSRYVTGFSYPWNLYNDIHTCYFESE